MCQYVSSSIHLLRTWIAPLVTREWFRWCVRMSFYIDLTCFYYIRNNHTDYSSPLETVIVSSCVWIFWYFSLQLGRKKGNPISDVKRLPVPAIVYRAAPVRLFRPIYCFNAGKKMYLTLSLSKYSAWTKVSVTMKAKIYTFQFTSEY